MENNIEKTVVNETITRNDLIDYAISKRVTEIEVKKAEAKKAYEDFMPTYNKKIKSINEKIQTAYKEEMDKYIQENYSDTISVMEKNLKAKAVYVDYESSKKDRLYDELAYMTRIIQNDVMVIFHRENYPIKRGYFHPMEILSDIASFLIIYSSDIKSEKIEKLESEKNSINSQLKELESAVKEFDKEISKVKSQKDLIKNSLIEETLSSTKEGRKVLDVLNNIDLSGTKLLK